jgi:hypothetical protein
MLQQLRCAVAQRAAATATAVPDARAADEELPADGARALNFFAQPWPWVEARRLSST